MAMDPTLTDLDDTALMFRVRGDDRAAFEVLVRRHQKMLLNFFLRSGVQYDSEDLVQLTFLRLYRYRSRYVAAAKFTTFLFLLARQVWIDELRRRRRHERLVAGLAAEPRADYAESQASGATLSGSMDLDQALAALPDGLRRVVELGVYRDLPYADIAEILGIPVGTVKSRMFNALAKLRVFLEKT